MKTDSPYDFLHGRHSTKFLFVNVLFAAIYFVAISFFFEHGNNILFALLILGEIFHVWQIFGYAFTMYKPEIKNPFEKDFAKPVDIYITVAGEPIDIVRRTVRAVKAIEYTAKSIYILNDGYVAGKEDWRDVVRLAKSEGVGCITRTKPGGAKAGNINNAMRQTTSPYVVIFDADHVPKPEFLKKTMGYFVDSRMGFVQTPQYYENQHVNEVTQTAWNQQALFFGPIMKGKNRTNSAFMCGTNMVLSRAALKDAGGMCEFNIAEDFLTSLFIHEKKWKSVYVPEVLAEGLAPEDFLSYYKQQFRWTRGSLEVIFKYNPLFRKGLTWAQKFQYLTSASYYLSGIVVLIDAMIPMIFLYTGIVAVTTSSMALAFVFLPYIFMCLYVLQQTSNSMYTFKAISFSISSFYLQIRALLAVLLNQKTSFTVTSKSALEGNFLYLAIPHMLYIALTFGGIYVALQREGLSASLLANVSWSFLNIIVFIPFILAAAPKFNWPFSRNSDKSITGNQQI